LAQALPKLRKAMCVLPIRDVCRLLMIPDQYYELRFPRVQKVFRTTERGWEHCTRLQELEEIALQAIGIDPPNKDLDDWCNNLWGKPSTPGAKCTAKRKAVAEMASLNKRWKTDSRIAEMVKSRVFMPLTNLSKAGVRSQSHDGARFVARQKEDKGVSATARRRRGSDSTTLCCKPSSKPPSPSNEDGLPPVAPPSPRNASEVGLSSTTDGGDCRAATITHPSAIDRVDALTGGIQSTPSRNGRIHAFFMNSLVWYLRPQGIPRTSRYRSYRKTVPSGNRVHSLQSLLVACNWDEKVCPPPGCLWVERGIVVIDNLEDSKRSVLCLLEELQRRLGRKEARKPIWVVDFNLLVDGGAEGSPSAFCKLD
jgi:DNA ligase 4